MSCSSLNVSLDRPLIDLLLRLSPQELKEVLPLLTPEERAATDRPLTAALLATNLEVFCDHAWPLLEPYPLSKGPWYWAVLCDYLTAVTEGKIRRLLITIPPRMGKSTLVSVMWPAWVWAGGGARSRWLFCSHSEELAIRDSVRRRNLLQSPWYRTFWPEVELASDVNLKHEYASTNAGEMYSTWIGGATGRGCDYLVIDDPHALADMYSPAELQKAVNFVKGTLFSRLNQPGKGRIVIIMQRLHVNDLVGELLDPSDDEVMERIDLDEEPKSNPPRPGAQARGDWDAYTNENVNRLLSSYSPGLR